MAFGGRQPLKPSNYQFKGHMPYLHFDHASIGSDGADQGPVSFGGDGRMRIGYISRRFEEYPGTQLMLRVFGLHDRTKFVVS